MFQMRLNTQEYIMVGMGVRCELTTENCLIVSTVSGYLLGMTEPVADEICISQDLSFERPLYGVVTDIWGGGCSLHLVAPGRIRNSDFVPVDDNDVIPFPIMEEGDYERRVAA